MKRLIAFYFFLQISNVCIGQDKKIRVPINNLNNQFELVGQLGETMGRTLTVCGVIVEGPHKGHEGGLNLVVQMINDSSIQQLIQIPVSPYFGKFGGNSIYKLPELKTGDTYRLRVYETGEFVGNPWDAYKEAGITFSNGGFYFSNRLIVISGKKIDSIEWSPSKFLGRNALLSGIAKNENDTAVILNSKWKLRLVNFRKWASSEIGKLAEVYGKINQTESNSVYNVENGESRLVKLEDQLGKTVRLRGRALNLNQYWWFNYRGTEIYVEKMEDLPNWTGRNHFRPMEITGILEQAEMPDLDQRSIEANPDRKLYYIVRKASWKPITELLSPELQFDND
jgi:hypothetical protein